jgi:tetratricopeptide (TPR) repeat protein
MAAAVLTACVSTGPVAEKSKSPAGLAEQYGQKAQTLENSGDIVEAAHYYQLALTVDPDNPRMLENLARVGTKRKELAQAYYQRGTRLYAQGKYADSRQALLTALRLQPDHAEALNKLKVRPRIAAKRFILHRIEPGETISIIAQKYYGDPGEYAYIAQFNNLPDATRIRLGQELKIPEIEGLPFYVDEQSQEVKTEAEESGSLTAWPAEDEVSYEEPTQVASVQQQAASYQATGLDFLQAKKYDAAIIEFNKVLSAQPDNTEVKTHMFRAHYEWARELLDQKEYLSAKQAFEKSLAFNQDCRKCHGLIEECETGYKEMHYQRGIQLFGAEKPDAAIAEWEKVSELDPDYKQVSQYIKKARTISENIKKLKQNSN